MAAGVALRARHGAREEKHRQHQDQRDQPGGHRHQSGHCGRPQPRRADRVTDGEVAVSREDHQEEGARHLVDAGGDHVEGAGQAPEPPALQDHRGHQEGNT